MNSWTELLACPFCKLGMDELQARAMEVSIYLLLALIYSLMGIIGFKVWRMMSREERELTRVKGTACRPDEQALTRSTDPSTSPTR